MNAALEHAWTLKALLEAELRRADEERAALRSVEPKAILDHATAREVFSARARAEVEAFQQRAAAALGLPEARALTRDAVRAIAVRDPGVRPLYAMMVELARLAAALDQRYRRNRALAEGALACVRGYLAAIAPRPAAYTRQGTASP